ncbi:MAG: hypothetical protein AAF226_08490 [Verrucomicrobiota bacterium]
MVFCILAGFILILSFFAQEFIPDFGWAFQARLLLVHAMFYSISVSVPFPVMLLFALIAGFIWDARYHIPFEAIADGDKLASAELPFGFTIFVFGLMGAFIQGVRPLFRSGRWELPVAMVGICTLGGLLIEYLVISFNRGGLAVSAEFWWKLTLTSLFSLLVAPFILLLLSRLADLTKFKIRYEGITRRYSYDGDAF